MTTKGSLARRVLFTSLLVLGIPLIIHTFLLYRQEYRENVTDTFTMLSQLTECKALYVKQMTQYQQGWSPKQETLESLATDIWGYPVGVSIIDSSGLIMLTTEVSLQGEVYTKSDTQTAWNPVPNFPNSWFLKTKRGRFLATTTSIQSTGLRLMLDLPESSLTAIQATSYVERVGLFLFLVCVIGGTILILLTRLLSKPLRSLMSAMQSVSEGALQVRYIPERIGFEINVLGIQFNQMLDALFASQKAQEKERVARERLAEEFKIGHQIQKSMLPIHFAVPFLEVVPCYHAALEVSGDFYDLFPLDDGRVLFAIADAAGKGISACLFTLSFRSMLRTAATLQKDLASLVRTANDLLVQDATPSSFFITAWIGIYDPKEGTLTYCSQGHPPALLLQKETLLPLITHGMALGAMNVEPKIATISLHPGDLLFLYTDGVIDANNPKGALFGMKRVEHVLQRHQEQNLSTISSSLLEEIHQFSEGAAQADDLTFILVRITKQK